MKFKYLQLFYGFILFFVLFNVVNVFNYSFLYIRSIISFIFLVTIPGTLILSILNIKKMPFWEYISHTVGLSLTVLMFSGLAINWLFPLVGIEKPLSLIPSLIGIDVVITTLLLFGYSRNRDNVIQLETKKISSLNYLFFILPLLFPILAIFGAINLNNNYSNILTMVLLGGISLYVFFLMIFKKRISNNIYPFSLFFISLSILFMTSLRGWNITGHDIMREYYVFQLTKANFYWNINFFKDPYNACLSITILPVIFSVFTRISDIYIYKILFQVLFSICPITIYLLFTKFTQRYIAFLAVLYFTSFPTFINDMSMINRQEVGYLFFGLLLLILFNSSLKPFVKKILFLIFGFSMVVSHYSTTYTTIFLLVVAYLIGLILRFNGFKIFKAKILQIKILKNKNFILPEFHLTGLMLILLILFAFFWNVQLTNTSQGLQEILYNSIANLNTTFKQDSKSGDVLYSIASNSKLNNRQLLNEYISSNIIEFRQKKISNIYYPSSTFKSYSPQLVPPKDLPLTQVGKLLLQGHINVISLNYFMRQNSAKLLQIFIIIGILGLIYHIKDLKLIDVEYIILCIAGLFFLLLLTVLPQLSIGYGLLRAFQQMLFLLALPAIIGCLVIFSFLKDKWSDLFVILITLFFFLLLSGFIPQFLGSYPPQLVLNNEGVYYDAYYIHSSEVKAANWLTTNRNKNYPIQADWFAGVKLFTLVHLGSSNDILPQLIRRDSYMFLDYSNDVNNKWMVFFKGNIFAYTFPISFLNQNKDLIYNNGTTEIFK